jgi:hypothetical protein
VISPAGHLFEKSLVTKALKVRGSADRPSPLPARDRGRSVDFRRAEGFFEARRPDVFPSHRIFFRGARSSARR